LRKFGVLRIVHVLRFVFRVEVVKIAEELVEAVYGGKKFVAVADVVLAELAGRITERLEKLSECGILV
jgi:hypothetical protein